LGRRQTAVLFVALAIPSIGQLLTISEANLRPYHDLMPLSFALSSSLALAGLTRLKIFDITPMARDVLVENLPEEVIVVDASGRVVYMNAAALNNLRAVYRSLAPELNSQLPANHPLLDVDLVAGIGEGQAIGRPFAMLYAHWPQLVQRAQGQADGEPLVFPDPEGRGRAFQVHITPLKGKFPSVGGRVIVLTDVSDLKAAEDELRRHRQDLEALVEQRTRELTLALEDVRKTRDELERRVFERTAELATQNRELETFAYSVSHDLKAPLRGIAGYSRLLEETCVGMSDPEVRQFIDNIRKAADQMQQLIEDLLSYARFQRNAAPMEKINVAEMMQQALDEFKEVLRSRAIKVDLQLECDYVFVEPLGLAQALRNLLDNAIKFTRDRPDPFIQVGTRPTPEGCLLWVRDNGIGFDMNYRERIFEIFQRLQHSEDYPGTGVGLALVRKAVDRIGGQVWAESVPGQGATFYILLPADHQC
jgi:signal transduction histidine kinase